MTHVFSANFTDSQVIITGDDAHHIKDVLRMKEGEDIFVSDGAGRNMLACISSFDSGNVICDILSEDSCDHELDMDIILYQALPKGDKMETIIQKCVELGVSRIVPVSTSRCIVRLDAKSAAKKAERWQKIAESAAKQSQRAVIPEISSVMSLKEAISDAARQDSSVNLSDAPQNAQNRARNVICYEGINDTVGLKDTLRGFTDGSVDILRVFIGPEGGFAQNEVEECVNAGFLPISLGRRILRTETAGMAIIAAVMMEREIQR